MNVKTFPEISSDDRRKFTAGKIELATYVRIKHKNKRYKLLVAKEYFYDTAHTKDIFQAIGKIYEDFIKLVYDAKYLFKVSKETIELLNKTFSDTLIEDTNILSEKDRLHVKIMLEQHRTNSITN